MPSTELPLVPSVTVAIPTRNRANGLPACLDAALAIRYTGAWSILVLDNASADETDAVLRRYTAAHPERLRAEFVPIPGLCHVRNRALAVADTELIVFIDDDCYPSPQLLEALTVEFADPRVGYAGGRLLLHDPTDAPYTINTNTDREVIEPYRWTDGAGIPGTGMAIRRSAGLQVGGWDPRFGPGGLLRSGDDIDMHWRLAMAGWRGIFTPDAVTYHHHGRKPGSPRLASLEEDYAIARGGWYAKLLRDGPLRGQTLKAWLWWRMPRQPLRQTMQELRGAARYLRARPGEPPHPVSGVPHP